MAAQQDLTNKKQNFMSRYVQAAQDLLVAREKLRALHNEWEANGYSSTIVQGDIQSGGLLHLTPAIMAGGFYAEEQLEAYMTNQPVATGDYQTNWNALVG